MASEIVDAVIEATVALLAEGGLGALTTNKIAGRAGVAIGSLYRYFPNREAIIAEVDLRYRRAAAERFLAALDEFRGDLAAAVRAAITAYAVGGPPLAVRHALMSEVPPGWLASGVERVWGAMLPPTVELLVERAPWLTSEEAARRIFLALHATQGVMTGMVLWPIREADSASVLEDLAAMITGMLTSR
ncbi:MAG: helix-turn-helix domain-containing protein [Kofleriaceae bacterium]